MKFNPVIVDLSHFDDVQDWDLVRSFGILGVINKATEGPGMTDKTFAIRRKPARDRDILYGAYHFLRPGNPIAQADHFLEVALSVSQPDELLLALDHEDRSVPLEDAKKWLQRVLEKAGRRAVLYSGFLIKAQLGKRRDPFLAEHRLWLSHFSSRPVCPPNWPAPWIIQFTGDGQGPEPHRVPGISIAGGIDLNHYGDTPEKLKAEWAKGPVLETRQADAAEPVEGSHPMIRRKSVKHAQQV
jgi:GH25 family lysozyme M1 (1,4-beta-N-acetylmuramidase)